MDDKIKIKGDKGTKGRKDNKKSVYSSKHIRNQQSKLISNNAEIKTCK